MCRFRRNWICSERLRVVLYRSHVYTRDAHYCSPTRTLFVKTRLKRCFRSDLGGGAENTQRVWRALSLPFPPIELCALPGHSSIFRLWFVVPESSDWTLFDAEIKTCKRGSTEHFLPQSPALWRVSGSKHLSCPAPPALHSSSGAEAHLTHGEELKNPVRAGHGAPVTRATLFSPSTNSPVFHSCSHFIFSAFIQRALKQPVLIKVNENDIKLSGFNLHSSLLK